jgi:hypothetical protein
MSEDLMSLKSYNKKEAASKGSLPSFELDHLEQILISLRI